MAGQKQPGICCHYAGAVTSFYDGFQGVKTLRNQGLGTAIDTTLAGTLEDCAQGDANRLGPLGTVFGM